MEQAKKERKKENPLWVNILLKLKKEKEKRKSLSPHTKVNE